MTDYTDLGKRLVQCKGFRWMPGMYALRTTHTGEFTGVRFFGNVDFSPEAASVSVVTDRQGVRLVASGHVVVDGWFRADTLIPDLRDDATKGCVMHLIREAWGTTAHFVRPSPEILEEAGFTDYGWALATGLSSRPLLLDIPSRRCLLGKTEEEAMVVAMEAAPAARPVSPIYPVQPDSLHSMVDDILYKHHGSDWDLDEF